MSSREFHVPALDGVRGLAAMIVVWGHTSFLGWYLFPGLNLEGVGKYGVFLFFVLSAYLLTQPMLAMGGKMFSAQNLSLYWQRRFFRIYPLYSLYLLAGLVTTWIFAAVFDWNIGFPFVLHLPEFLAHLFLVEGWGVTWSISVEFKFYFVLPLVVGALLVLRDVNRLLPPCAIIVLAVVSLAVSPPGESVNNDTRLLPYMPVFLAGILLAVVQHEVNLAGGLNRFWLAVAKLLGLVAFSGLIVFIPAIYSLLFDTVSHRQFHREFLLYGVLWGFAIFSVVNVKGLVQAFLATRLLRYLGALSFSIYLFHPVFIWVLDNSRFAASPFNAWIVIIASVVSAHVSFVVLERPASNVRLEFRRRENALGILQYVGMARRER